MLEYQHTKLNYLFLFKKNTKLIMPTTIYNRACHYFLTCIPTSYTNYLGYAYLERGTTLKMLLFSEMLLFPSDMMKVETMVSTYWKMFILLGINV